MRILQIINALTLGGAQFFLLDLAKESRNAGHSVKIAAFRDGPVGDLLRQEGFEVTILGETFMDLPAAILLLRLTNGFRPHVVHAHLFRATFWARVVCKWWLQLPLVCSIHGCETASFHRLEKFSQNFSDYLLFPSHYLKDWYGKSICNLKQDRFKVIYPGVALSTPPPPRNPTKTVKIGTLSRLHPVKGIDKLISACAQLQRENYKIELFIGGNGKQKEMLERLAIDCGLSKTCIFVDKIIDKQAFLENLDIFVAPSRQEAFGIHICEAMERGLPTVGANVGGIPELILHDQTGMLFSHDNENQLYSCLKQLIENPDTCKKMGADARTVVEKNFNRDVAIFEHLKLYSSLGTRTRKIHFVISSSELGGGERVALGLISGLKKRNWQISATCAGDPLQSKLSAEKISCSSSSLRAGGLFFALKLITDRNFYQADVINTHLNRASLISGIIAKFLRKPLISHVHGLNKKSYYRHSQKLIAVSQAVKDNLVQQGVNAETVHTFANRINKPSMNARQLSQKTLTICITAKLHPNKGHKWALEAIANNMQALGKIKILIIGDGQEKANLERFCRSNKLKNSVCFTGFIENPDDYYPQVDLALLPSLGEGIPLSLLETMRWGIPCIATDVGGIPEIITDGENGILIKPGDSAALVEAILKMRDPAIYDCLSKGSITHYNLINDFEKQISEIESLFESLIEAHS